MPDILIDYGTDPKEMTLFLMRQANIRQHLHPDMRVVIKPNLVVSRPASEGATTHPQIVEGIVAYLQGAGIRDIVIAEGAWVGDSTRKAFQNCGYNDLAKRCGVRLVDTKSDPVVERRQGDLALKLCKTIVEADYLINVPVLKGHCQTEMTCCLKNLKGCIPDSEKRRYHTMGLHKPIAALAALLRPQLHIIDGICGDPTFEEGGNPVESNRILLGFDPVRLDSYCAQLLGLRADEVGYLLLAGDSGVGRFADSATEVAEYHPEWRPKHSHQSSRIVQRLAPYIEEKGACSACYAALVAALNKIGTSHLDGKVKIGQGFRTGHCAGIGVGNCAAGCTQHVGGCPPSALDIVEFLQRQ